VCIPAVIMRTYRVQFMVCVAPDEKYPLDHEGHPDYPLGFKVQAENHHDAVRRFGAAVDKALAESGVTHHAEDFGIEEPNEPACRATMSSHSPCLPLPRCARSSRP
jgi:hypothetical protein